MFESILQHCFLHHMSISQFILIFRLSISIAIALKKRQYIKKLKMKTFTTINSLLTTTSFFPVKVTKYCTTQIMQKLIFLLQRKFEVKNYYSLILKPNL